MCLVFTPELRHGTSDAFKQTQPCAAIVTIIFSKNEKEHLKHMEIIFKKLKEAGLKLKESKCDFFK